MKNYKHTNICFLITSNLLSFSSYTHKLKKKYMFQDVVMWLYYMFHINHLTMNCMSLKDKFLYNTSESWV